MFKTTSDGKKWIIFNNALASYIVKHGGRVVSIAPLREDTRFCIFFFSTDDKAAEAAIVSWLDNAQHRVDRRDNIG